MNIEMSRRRNIFERHRKKTLAALLLCAVGCTDLVSTFLWNGYQDYRRKKNDFYRVQSSAFHHGFMPNVDRAPSAWGPHRYEFSSNSLGFRDATNRVVPLAAPSQRLLLIGDSFTEGIGIEYPSTFAGILAAELAPRQIEVLNAAVSSYSPIFYYRRVKHLLEEVGLEFHDVAVFLDLSDIHDETKYRLDDSGVIVENEAPPASAPAAQGFAGRAKELALKHSSLAAAAHRIARSTRNLFLAREDPRQRRDHWDVDNYRALWTIDDSAFRAYGAAGLANAAEHLAALHELLAARGIGMILVVYPWPDQIFAGDRDSKQVEVWRSWANERGVRFIDLFPPFFAREDRSATLDEYFLRADCHWNEDGHKLIAAEFLRALPGATSRK